LARERARAHVWAPRSVNTATGLRHSCKMTAGGGAMAMGRGMRPGKRGGDVPMMRESQGVSLKRNSG